MATAFNGEVRCTTDAGADGGRSGGSTYDGWSVGPSESLSEAGTCEGDRGRERRKKAVADARAGTVTLWPLPLAAVCDVCNDRTARAPVPATAGPSSDLVDGAAFPMLIRLCADATEAAAAPSAGAAAELVRRLTKAVDAGLNGI